MWACGCVLLSSYYAELTLLSALFVPLMINFGIKAISRHLVIVLIWEFSCWTKKAPQTVTVLLRSGGKYFVSKKGQQPLFLSFLSASWAPTTCRVLYFLRATTSKTLFCPGSWQNLLATFRSHASVALHGSQEWVKKPVTKATTAIHCRSLNIGFSVYLALWGIFSCVCVRDYSKVGLEREILGSSSPLSFICLFISSSFLLEACRMCGFSVVSCYLTGGLVLYL